MNTLVEKAGEQVHGSTRTLRPYDNASCHSHSNNVFCDIITHAQSINHKPSSVTYSLRHQDIQLEIHGKPRKLHSGWLAALARPYSSSSTSETACSHNSYAYVKLNDWFNISHPDVYLD